MELVAVKFNEKDKEMQEIQAWQNHPNMTAINKYVLNNYPGDKNIETFTNFISNKLNVIPSLEIKSAAICYKDTQSNNEIAGFVLISAFKTKKIHHSNKSCHIEAVCINPDYPAGRGIGRYMLYDLLKNSQNYLNGFKPDYFSANVVKDNIASLTMLKHAGFTLTENNNNYYAYKFALENNEENEKI